MDDTDIQRKCIIEKYVNYYDSFCIDKQKQKTLENIFIGTYIVTIILMIYLIPKAKEKIRKITVATEIM